MLPSFTNKCKFSSEKASQKQNDCKSLKVSSNFLDKCKSDVKIRRQNRNKIKWTWKASRSSYSTCSRQKFSDWMVKRYCIQDYPEYLGGNTETIAIASDFLWPAAQPAGEARKRKRTWWDLGQWRLTGVTSEKLKKLFSSELYP